MKQTKAILFVNHGTQSKDAIAEFDQTVELVRQKMGGAFVAGAHMGSPQPDIPAVFDDLVVSGCTDIVVIPYFLFMENHIRHELPVIFEGLQAAYPGISISFGKPIFSIH